MTPDDEDEERATRPPLAWPLALLIVAWAWLALLAWAVAR